MTWYMCWCIFGFHVNCKGQKGYICLIFNIQHLRENYAVVGYLLSKSPTVLSKRPSSSMIQTLAPGDNATHASHIDQFCKSLHRPYKFELCASQWNSINIQWGGKGRGDGIRSWLMSRCYLHLQRSRHLLHPPPATPHSQILSFNPSPIHCPSWYSQPRIYSEANPVISVPCSWGECTTAQLQPLCKAGCVKLICWI